MTRSPETQALIEKAMAIIGPAADQDLVARGVMETRGYVKRSSKTFIASGYYGEVTTNHKKAAQRMAAALRLLQHALRDSNLVRRYDDLREDELERWRQRYQEAALKPGLSRAYRALNHAQYVAAKGAAAQQPVREARGFTLRPAVSAERPPPVPTTNRPSPDTL